MSQIKMDKYKLQEHKELTKSIFSCKCMPLGNKTYCNSCNKLIIDFMNEHGAGVLTQDIFIEDLKKEKCSLISENKSLNNKLDKKTKKLEEYKQTIKNIFDRFDKYSTIKNDKWYIELKSATMGD